MSLFHTSTREDAPVADDNATPTDPTATPPVDAEEPTTEEPATPANG